MCKVFNFTHVFDSLLSYGVPKYEIILYLLTVYYINLAIRKIVICTILLSSFNISFVITNPD